MTVGEERPEDVAAPAEEGDSHPSLAGASPGAGDDSDHVELLPSRGPLRTVMKTVGLIEQSIGLSLIVVILFLVLVQVAQRYIHTFGGWPWTGEVGRLSLVWCTFVLAGYLMAQDRHITIKVVDLVLPEWLLSPIILLSHLLVAVTCLGMAYATYRLIADDIGQVTPAAEIPVAWIYVMPLVGYALTAVRALMMVGLVDIQRIARAREQAP